VSIAIDVTDERDRSPNAFAVLVNDFETVFT